MWGIQGEYGGASPWLLRVSCAAWSVLVVEGIVTRLQFLVAPLIKACFLLRCGRTVNVRELDQICQPFSDRPFVTLVTSAFCCSFFLLYQYFIVVKEVILTSALLHDLLLLLLLLLLSLSLSSSSSSLLSLSSCYCPV